MGVLWALLSESWCKCAMRAARQLTGQHDTRARKWACRMVKEPSSHPTCWSLHWAAAPTPPFSCTKIRLYNRWSPAALCAVLTSGSRFSLSLLSVQCSSMKHKVMPVSTTFCFCFAVCLTAVWQLHDVDEALFTSPERKLSAGEHGSIV